MIDVLIDLLLILSVSTLSAALSDLMPSVSAADGKEAMGGRFRMSYILYLPLLPPLLPITKARSIDSRLPFK